MITDDEVAIEQRMSLVHTCLKDIDGSARTAAPLPHELRPLIGRAAAAILAPRRRLSPDSADELTRLLRELSEGSDWSVRPVAPPKASESLSSFYRSGADVETLSGDRFDVWALLVNARIGLIAPRLGPRSLPI